MAAEADPRKRFISATAANYFGLDPAAAPAALRARPELSGFLDDGGEFLLVVRRSGDGLSASNKISVDDFEVMFGTVTISGTVKVTRAVEQLNNFTDEEPYLPLSLNDP